MKMDPGKAINPTQLFYEDDMESYKPNPVIL